MRVGVTAGVEHSMFSSGTANASLAVAELMKELGHDVELLSLSAEGAKKGWWDDCRSLAGSWQVVSLAEAKEAYDLILEIGPLVLSAAQRKLLAPQGSCVWVVRHPPLLSEIEATLYPTIHTLKREFEGLTETWILDAAAAAEKGSIQMLELLTRRPVRIVPYVWSPSPVAALSKEASLPPWIATTVAELTRMQKAAAESASQQGSDPPLPPWRVHIAETNSGNGSSAVLPLVILREAKRRGVPVGRFTVHNSGVVRGSKFFQENIVRHCTTGGGVDLSGDFVERQISAGWVCEPMSCVLSHIRFAFLRPLLLDLAWMGIPVVHNSLALKGVGHGLERLYYSDNKVGEACDAMLRMTADLMSVKGVFAPDALPAIREALLGNWTPLSPAVQQGWKEAVARVAEGSKVPPAATAVAAKATASPAASPAAAPAAPAAPAAAKPFHLGFCDMWDQFNPSYNFFSLALSEAGSRMTPPIQVVAGPATPTDDLVIFGPFGDSWKQLPASQPKAHFTGENTAPVDASGVVLNLGFGHYDMSRENYLRFPLWILEIDWFGADAARIANPKPIPLAVCTTVDTSEEGLARARAQRQKFCAFVVSNPSNPVRNAAFHWLSAYKSVDSAGRLFNNVGSAIFAGAGGGGGEQAKVAFFRDYKFALTYENNSARGYTTEKYLHAKAAGSIPIYWGDPAFERDFDINGCIDAREARTPEELISLVRRVDEDDAEWVRRYSVPALDSYKVAWCQRTIAELCRRLFAFGGRDASSAPRMIGDRAIATAAAAAPKVAEQTLELPVLVTYANRRFLSSLQQWLGAAAAQRRAVPQLQAIVYVDPDIPAETLDAIKERHGWAAFRVLPSAEGPPAGAFPDFWAPQHYGWKLWILREVCGEAALAGRMVLYMDAGTFLCRWPQAWLKKAQEAGICLLEDPREENGRWCSPAFCAALGVTEAEKGEQQVQAATVAFRAAAPVARDLFEEAFRLACRREVLAGDKWLPPGPDGKPRGHRHDQSILSILSSRASPQRLTPRYPLDEVQCGVSLRETFESGRAIYIHRGNFQMHRRFAQGIDEAYVINLDRRTDRMDRLWANHPGLEGRVKRWSAVEGRALQLTPALERLLRPNDFFWKKAVAGCALSHLGLWWKLATDHPDIQNYLVLEDDVKLKPQWEAAWQHAIAEGHVPDDYDVIYLGGVLPPNRGGWAHTKERVNESFVRVAENQAWGQTAPTRYFHFCAYAYVLSKRGAEKVMDLLDSHGGYWTSADHILCNPVKVLKSYMLDPEGAGMLAGCYQDDDPKYATAEFNNFSRIDSFDSDLWNNDERFSEEEVLRAAGEAKPDQAAAAKPDQAEAPLDIAAALADARACMTLLAQSRKAELQEAATELIHELKREEDTALSATVPALTAAPSPTRRPVKLLPRRLVCLPQQKLELTSLHECDWLMYLFGAPSMASVECIDPVGAPPTDEPIVVVQRPLTEQAAAMMERWSELGATFKVLHLSDEAPQPDLRDPIGFYDLSGCKGVLRFYQREDLELERRPHVKVIPLGYHWTLREGSQDCLTKTPRLPFRETAWTFLGTGWGGRSELLAPLAAVGPHRAKFFGAWNDPAALGHDEYIATMLDSIFVPCPDGVNAETFRFYEALECGCVPLVVRTPQNGLWLDWVAKKVPVLQLASWPEAAGLMHVLTGDKARLEGYREGLLRAWMAWREELRSQVAAWLAGAESA